MNRIVRSSNGGEGGTWYLYAHDNVAGKQGQIEYLQMQIVVHTLPNRATTRPNKSGLRKAGRHE